MTTKAAKPEKEAPEAISTPKAHKPKYGDIKTGDLHAFVYWGIIERKLAGESVSVKSVDKDGPPMFNVHGRSLNESSFSADQFHETRKASKTEVAEILVKSFNMPFTVCFDKQEGEERILRGRLIAPEPLLGRSHVEDLDITDGHRIRLVDHRSLKWLIVNGIKYVVGRK